MLRCSDAESPQAATPAVLGGRHIRPHAGVVHAIATSAGGVLGVEDEVQGEAAQPQGKSGIGFAGRDDEHAGIVVGAAAVLPTADRAPGMFEQTAMVAETVEVLETEVCRRSHIATDSVESIRWSESRT